MVELDNTVPVPKRKKYKWDEMRIGDSFFAKAKKIKSMRSQAWAAGRRYAARFAVREDRLNGCDGVRVWRVQ